jgi:hypothetical protein
MFLDKLLITFVCFHDNEKRKSEEEVANNIYC